MLDRGLLFLLLQGVGVLGQECAVGKYGEHCQLNCSRHCAPYSGQDVHCHRHSGKCSEGCIPGWYGDQCQLSCSRNCQQHICSQQTGHCTLGCKGNNMGDFCETPIESGPKQGENETAQEPASTPVAAILVPVFTILIIIIIGTVIVLVFRHRKYEYIILKEGSLVAHTEVSS
ncbi:scavenger receptor class F member 1-like [Haliotis rufescens]|uniref:scavenger receptor class F member 1-like n=1 Tax=Haliotis rufescens TaxID=6454 RepID=UPI00201EB547|nr:scavenger receptor class F member 1-like [Haliotis rufescens]XP_048246282.1 scavenger receptor class F member 1-like [Haliotis rufescens]